MSGVLRGINQRTKGNIESETKFDINSLENKKNSTEQMNEKTAVTKDDSKKSDSKKVINNKKGNQYAQIKISKSLKDELEAIKIIEKTKFDYELLQLLVDSYVRNELSPSNRKKFKLLLELNE